MKIFVCDYQKPRDETLESFIIEADSLEEAEDKAIQELKSLKIPKRYLVNIMEVL